jgi:hypothetical protein
VLAPRHNQQVQRRGFEARILEAPGMVCHFSLFCRKNMRSTVRNHGQGGQRQTDNGKHGGRMPKDLKRGETGSADSTW